MKCLDVSFTDGARGEVQRFAWELPEEVVAAKFLEENDQIKWELAHRATFAKWILKESKDGKVLQSGHLTQKRITNVVITADSSTQSPA